MTYFNLLDFPKFIEAYKNDEARTWLCSLKNAGYNSVKQHAPHSAKHSYSMADEQYTWFILKYL